MFQYVHTVIACIDKIKKNFEYVTRYRDSRSAKSKKTR